MRDNHRAPHPRTFVSVEVSEELYERLMSEAGGLSVAARMLFEQALERAMRAEFKRIDTSHRMKVHRQRQRFGWRW